MQFKSEVTFGTIISTLALLGAGTAAWSSNQAKISHMEAEVHALKEADKEIKSQAIKTENDIIKRLDEIRADVREIRNTQRK